MADKPARRTRKSPISEALDGLFADDSEEPRDGTSTAEDRAEVEQVFEQLAAGHVQQVRNVMLELQVEDVACSWIESSKSALTSLRKMAEQMELAPLCEALDEFCGAVDHAVASGQSRVGADRKSDLLARYERLVELIPQAFALEGERDRREPIIVESLLRQIPEVEKITIDKLFAVGLDRLQALMRTNAGDIAAAAGVRPEVARKIADRFRAYRESTTSAVSACDVSAEHRDLRRLVGELEHHHDEYERAAAGWSSECRERKSRARKLREESFLAIRVALARLGETERLQQIEKRTFQQRISDLERYLDEMAAATRATPRSPKGSENQRSLNP